MPDGKIGRLLMSDLTATSIYKWTPQAFPVSATRAGYSGTDSPTRERRRSAGSGGRMIGRKVKAGSAGPPRVVRSPDGHRMRLEKDGSHTVVADKYAAQGFNGPTDS